MIVRCYSPKAPIRWIEIFDAGAEFDLAVPSGRKRQYVSYCFRTLVRKYFDEKLFYVSDEKKCDNIANVIKLTLDWKSLPAEILVTYKYNNSSPILFCSEKIIKYFDCIPENLYLYTNT